MLSFIPCGDLELNIGHPHGTPTLVPSAALERRLDWRLVPSAVSAGGREPLPVAMHLHVHYLETLPILIRHLQRCRTALEPWRLWISTDSSAKALAIRNSLEASGLGAHAAVCNVIVCPNRGRNLGPLLHHLWPELSQEALLLHLHGKCSPHGTAGADWLEHLLTTLLPDPGTVWAIRGRFAADPGLGLLIPQAPELIRPWLNWGSNFELASQLAMQMQGPLHRDAVLTFPAGSMFWCRPAALAPLAQCCSSLPELPPEPLPLDGSSLHAMERLMAHSCEVSGLGWRLLCRQSGLPEPESPSALSVWEPRPRDFQDATALLAARCRQQHAAEQRSTGELDHCRQRLQAAEEQIRELIEQVADRDQRLEALSRTWSRRLAQLLRALSRRHAGFL